MANSKTNSKANTKEKLKAVSKVNWKANSKANKLNRGIKQKTVLHTVKILAQTLCRVDVMSFKGNLFFANALLIVYMK